jgi:hypothetical protein
LGTLVSGYEPGELLATTKHPSKTIQIILPSQVVMKEPKSYFIEKLNESNHRSWSQIIESHLDD